MGRAAAEGWRQREGSEHAWRARQSLPLHTPVTSPHLQLVGDAVCAAQRLQHPLLVSHVAGKFDAQVQHARARRRHHQLAAAAGGGGGGAGRHARRARAGYLGARASRVAGLGPEESRVELELQECVVGPWWAVPATPIEPRHTSSLYRAADRTLAAPHAGHATPCCGNPSPIGAPGSLGGHRLQQHFLASVPGARSRPSSDLAARPAPLQPACPPASPTAPRRNHRRQEAGAPILLGHQPTPASGGAPLWQQRRQQRRASSMSALLRARVSAFLAGVAVAGVFGVYQLRGDVAEGQQRLLDQVGATGRCLDASWCCLGAAGLRHTSLHWRAGAISVQVVPAGWACRRLAAAGPNSRTVACQGAAVAGHASVPAAACLHRPCRPRPPTASTPLTASLPPSHTLQTKRYTSGLEARVAELEAAVARLSSKS